jgi:hypothetical protein
MKPSEPQGHDTSMAVCDRYVLIRDGKTGVDELVDKILSESDSPEKQAFNKACELRHKIVKKRYIEACFLASTDIPKISTILGIPVPVLESYQKIFYDIEGMDNLDRLELLESTDREESMLKTWALSQGLDFITWRIGGAVSIDPVEGLNDLFTIATYKSKEALFSANSSDSSKEAVKWVKTSADLARLIKAWVMDGDSARKDIELALEVIRPKFEGLDVIKEDLGFDLTLLNTETKLMPLPGSSSD